MKAKFVLPQKYADLGFKISKFGKKSQALRWQDKVVFVFNSDLDVRDDFISRLCDYQVNLDTRIKVTN